MVPQAFGLGARRRACGKPARGGAGRWPSSASRSFAEFAERDHVQSLCSNIRLRFTVLEPWMNRLYTDVSEQPRESEALERHEVCLAVTFKPLRARVTCALLAAAWRTVAWRTRSFSDTVAAWRTSHEYALQPSEPCQRTAPSNEGIRGRYQGRWLTRFLLIQASHRSLGSTPLKSQ